VLHLAPGEASYISGYTLSVNAYSRPEAEVAITKKPPPNLD